MAQNNNTNQIFKLKKLRLSAFFLTIALLCTIESQTYAKANELMSCLGQEELKIHRSKSTGPAYFLNQLFINELSALYGVNLTPKSLKIVCNSSDFSPSVTLLKLLLLKGESAFVRPKGTGGVEALKTSSLSGFVDRIPHVFFQYLSKLQALAPIPCLDLHIPEVSFFIERFKYLEGEIDSKQLMRQSRKIESTFRKLRNLGNYIKSCEELEKKIKEENKRMIIGS
jgi:hypothetical protein